MIPYTIDRRPDTGVTNVTMGVWLLLASEVMLFGALFSSYALLRTAAVDWPSGRAVLNLPSAIGNTAVLGLVTALAWRARRVASVSIRWWLGAGATLAVLFVLLQAAEYSTAIAAGWRPSTNTFFATYFTLTGLHACHVLAGAVANVWTIAGAAQVPPALTGGRVHGLSLYWMFVVAVWILIVGLLYLS